MKSKLHQKSLLTRAALRFFPDSIQSSVLDDFAFRKRNGLEINIKFTVNNTDITFCQIDFINAVIEAFKKHTKKPTIKSENGDIWEILVNIENTPCVVEISNLERRFSFTDLWPVASDSLLRLKSFESEAKNVNFSADRYTSWKKLLASRALSVNELEIYHQEVSETPVHILGSLKYQILNGNVTLSELVPASSKYYEQLIGICGGSQGIDEFAAAGLSNHIKQLFAWSEYDGLLMTLVLSSHSLTTTTIDVGSITEENFIKALKFLQRQGDIVSIIGAIEIGISKLKSCPSATPYLLKLIEKIRDQDPISEHGQLKLLSSLVVLVDGELARTKTLADKPPFWRRMASIAHASILERVIIELNIDSEKICQAILHSTSEIFNLQTFADLRMEPRWLPAYILPQQLKVEFIGRIFEKGQSAGIADEPSLSGLFDREGSNSLFSHMKFPHPFIPGPLEGGLKNPNILPIEISEIIENDLKSQALNSTSFSSLLNFALVFQIESKHTELAIKALHRVHYHLNGISESKELISIMIGLASVAAVVRNVELAENVKSLARRSKARLGKNMSTDDLFVIGLIAAASNQDMNSWCNFVADWITEIAFQSSDIEELQKFFFQIIQLCRIVPQLNQLCGRAIAAIDAAIGH